MIEKVKKVFTRYERDLEYVPGALRFSWRGELAHLPLPREAGVYCLLSHDDTRVQKVGKTEKQGGLRARLSDYTVRRTMEYVAGDPTDLLWRKAMEGPLLGQPLGVYYYVTTPKRFPSPVCFDDAAIARELSCHWARSLEVYVSQVARTEGHPMLLSGVSD